MMEKLQEATRKLDIPTRTGIFCLSRKGAKTGSGATNNSTMKNVTQQMLAVIMDAVTVIFDHCEESEARTEIKA